MNPEVGNDVMTFLSMLMVPFSAASSCVYIRLHREHGHVTDLGLAIILAIITSIYIAGLFGYEKYFEFSFFRRLSVIILVFAIFAKGVARYSIEHNLTEELRELKKNIFW